MADMGVEAERGREKERRERVSYGNIQSLQRSPKKGILDVSQTHPALPEMENSTN